MKKVTAIALGALLLVGCAKKNDAGKLARENFAAALNDSIAAVQAEIDSCNSVVATLGNKVGYMLEDFTAVKNPREVEGYTIMKGWENRYPLQQTGVVARISDAEGLELIASLKGGVFDQLRVTSGEMSAVTPVIPHDQALNYRREGLTTVMFTGEAADSVARLITDNELNPITVTYLNGGRPTGTWKITNDYAKMISMTTMLYNDRSTQTRLERRVIMLGEKLKLLRQHVAPEETEEK